MKEFRLLEASEIDVRVATINEKGLTLLLYKDARVDQNILDETVGSMNWQRHHSRDNRNCTVAIWDEDKRQWVEKEDTGVESFTEKEKGLASDSFKRACFNWGIGRELYTAPFIYIKASDCEIIKNEKGKWVCYDNFVVKDISYDDKKNITQLVIRNLTKSKDVFALGKKLTQQKKSKEPPTEAPAEEVAEPTIEMATNKEKNIFIATCQQLGVDYKEIAKQAGVTDKMTTEQYARCMVILKEIKEGRDE